MMNPANASSRACRAALVVLTALVGACEPGDVAGPDAHSTRDARVADAATPAPDAAAMDAAAPLDAVAPTPDAPAPPPDAPAPPTDAPAPPPDAPRPTTLDLHDAILTNNPPDLADWPVTTTITEVDFQYMGGDGVHVEFSRRDGEGSWPDITPPGWDGPLEYTLGFAEYIDGHWYASAAIQFWRGLQSSGGNVAADVPTGMQCTAFGHSSSCQVARNWYYDGRWGALANYQPATGEIIGVFVVAGNVRGVMDGSQSPVHERSNVVLVPMPTAAGATYRF